MFIPAIVCLALAQIAQQPNPEQPTPPAPPAQRQVVLSSLPDEWMGEWRGTLHIADRNVQIPMGLDIRPVEGRDAWTWRLTYGEQPAREYTLVATERKGRFVLDENNGILLDMRLDERTMHSVFGVGEIMIVSRYELTDDGALVNEIITIATGSPRTSEVRDAPAGSPVERVDSHLVTGRQRAVMRKQ